MSYPKEECTCSGFVLQYEGKCCCGFAEASQVKVKISSVPLGLTIKAEATRGLSNKEKDRLVKLLLRAGETFIDEQE